jgi:hypothetical protein
MLKPGRIYFFKREGVHIRRQRHKVLSRWTQLTLTAALAAILPPKPNVFLEDNTMEIAGQTRFDIAQRQVKNRNATFLLGYSIFASVLLIAIYLGSMSSGIAPGDLASMTVFP